MFRSLVMQVEGTFVTLWM